MKTLDYQWPSSFVKNTMHDNNFSNESIGDVIGRIEDFFSHYYDCHACLMPSGRSSISILLRYLNFDRSKTIFISKWSSHCLYSCIGPYSNISTDFVDPDLILVNHKWGYKSYLHQNFTEKVIIEDSVDTIHLDRSSLLQNNGIAEIISLPKIIGSFSGGLVLTRDENVSNYIRNAQQENVELGRTQSKKKYNSVFNIKNEYGWEYCEHMNTSLDIIALKDIENSMKNLYKNINIISHRREIVLKKFKNIVIDSKRLGPVIVFPMSSYKILSKESSFMVRKFNYSVKTNSDYYESSYLLPVHFAISNEYFQSLLDAIVKR